jgi:hypothetical protein
MSERIKRSLAFAAMPFQWMYRGCYDREAHVVAWKHSLAWFFLGRGWRFKP